MRPLSVSVLHPLIPRPVIYIGTGELVVELDAVWAEVPELGRVRMGVGNDAPVVQNLVIRSRATRDADHAALAAGAYGTIWLRPTRPVGQTVCTV